MKIIKETKEDIEEVTQLILHHLTKFGLQMHAGKTQNKSKTEAMYFPESVTEAKKKFETLPEPIQLDNGKTTYTIPIHSDTWDQQLFLTWRKTKKERSRSGKCGPSCQNSCKSSTAETY